MNIFTPSNEMFPLSVLLVAFWLLIVNRDLTLRIAKLKENGAIKHEDIEYVPCICFIINIANIILSSALVYLFYNISIPICVYLRG